MTKQVKKPRIFLSYAHVDMGKVNELYQKLIKIGYSPWMDIHDLLPGQDWHNIIMRMIEDTTFFVACLSKNSVNKRGVIQEEFKRALDIWQQKLVNDIYFIPVRLEECEVPQQLSRFHWVDLFKEQGFEKLTKALRAGLKDLRLIALPILRSQSIENLVLADIKKMLMEFNFFDRNKNRLGEGIYHLYEILEIDGDKIVIDHTTQLTWQQSGSEDHIIYEDAHAYIDHLNKNNFASYNSWRLPTLEEAMSLMEPVVTEIGYINPVFDIKQSWIWTADHYRVPNRWIVDFNYGGCNTDSVRDDYYVRAVRSGIN